jgi:hypothetical protein
MELGRREALGLTSVMSRALAVVHGLFLRAVSHALSFGIRGSALDEGRVKPSPERRSVRRSHSAGGSMVTQLLSQASSIQYASLTVSPQYWACWIWYPM